MSVNLGFVVKVEGYAPTQCRPLIDAILVVLRQEGLDPDCVVEQTGESKLEAYTTGPVSISGAYRWTPVFETRIAEAVHAVVPGAAVRVDWSYPDEE